MSDENGKAEEAKAPEAEQPVPQFVLTITYTPKTGAIQLNGPLQDRILCHGMLGIAGQEVERFNQDRAAKMALLKPGAHLPPGLAGK